MPALITHLRRDAARNRSKVLEAAREALAERQALSFNDLARRAEVGVGTVYRHFPSVEVLREHLVAESLDELVAVGREATQNSEPGVGLARFLASVTQVQMRDEALEQVIEAATDHDPHTTAVKAELNQIFLGLIRAAAGSGALQPGVTPRELIAMVCGVAHSARLLPADEVEAGARRFMSIMIAGLGLPPGDEDELPG